MHVTHLDYTCYGSTYCDSAYCRSTHHGKSIASGEKSAGKLAATSVTDKLEGKVENMSRHMSRYIAVTLPLHCRYKVEGMPRSSLAVGVAYSVVPLLAM